MKKYQPDSFYVEFYRVEPEEKVGVIAVKCTAMSGSETNVSVSYKYIALSDSGSEFVANFTSQEYREFIGEWKQLLEKYFATSR